MATASEIKLLLAIVTSGQVSGIDWTPVGLALGCNKRAAAERWRAFKLKLPLSAGKAATESQAKLLLAIVGSVQVSGVDWEKVGGELGCNKRAAAERWRAFRIKRGFKSSGGKGEGEGQGVEGDDAAGKKRKIGTAKATAEQTKAANGGGAKKGMKRKVEEDSEEEVAAEGGPVGGGSGMAKRRARVASEEPERVKVKSDEQADDERDGTDGEEDEFFEADDGSGEAWV